MIQLHGRSFATASPQTASFKQSIFAATYCREFIQARPPSLKEITAVMRRFFLSSFFVLSFFFPAFHSFGATESTPHPLLIGYFPQWGIYNDPPYYMKELVTSGAAPLLDQLNYAQGFIINARCAVADPNADLNLTYTAVNSIDGKPDKPSSPLRG